MLAKPEPRHKDTGWTFEAPRDGFRAIVRGGGRYYDLSPVGGSRARRVLAARIALT